MSASSRDENPKRQKKDFPGMDISGSDNEDDSPLTGNEKGHGKQ